VAEPSQRPGRDPTTREIAAELGMSLDEFGQAQIAFEVYRPLSLDTTVSTAERSAQSGAARCPTASARFCA
jgi:DNA-directed RNA polymerase specialized sigma subunit